ADALRAGGGETSNEAFPPLPRHMLDQPFQTQDPEAFIANPFWVSQYVGAGPYKLERWEPGSFLEGVAFDDHILGRPKIQRIRELFTPDANIFVETLIEGAGTLNSGDW